jgi:hypothetical protein
MPTESLSNPLITILHQPNPSNHSPYPSCPIITKIPLKLLLSISSWAESLIINGNSLFADRFVIPPGLDFCMVDALFDWMKLVGEAISEDAETWSEMVFVGEGEEIRVSELGLERADGEVTLMGWVEMYHAFVTLGIRGGPLRNTKNYLLERIMAIMGDAYQVLKVEEVVRLWECFYVSPDHVGERGVEILRAALVKAAGISEGNEAMANSYIWGFQNAARPDLLKTFLGFMIEKEGFKIPPKDEVDDDSGIGIEIERKYGIVPELVIEGESSKCLDLQKDSERTIEWRTIKEADKLFVGWRPKPRDVVMVDAPSLEEGPTTIWEGMTSGIPLTEVVERPVDKGPLASPRPSQWLKKRTSSY